MRACLRGGGKVGRHLGRRQGSLFGNRQNRLRRDRRVVIHAVRNIHRRRRGGKGDTRGSRQDQLASGQTRHRVDRAIGIDGDYKPVDNGREIVGRDFRNDCIGPCNDGDGLSAVHRDGVFIAGLDGAADGDRIDLRQGRRFRGFRRFRRDVAGLYHRVGRRLRGARGQGRVQDRLRRVLCRQGCIRSGLLGRRRRLAGIHGSLERGGRLLRFRQLGCSQTRLILGLLGRRRRQIVGTAQVGDRRRDRHRIAENALGNVVRDRVRLEGHARDLRRQDDLAHLGAGLRCHHFADVGVNLCNQGIAHRRKVVSFLRRVADGCAVIHRDGVFVAGLDGAGDGDGIDLGNLGIGAHVGDRCRHRGSVAVNPVGGVIGRCLGDKGNARDVRRQDDLTVTAAGRRRS